MRLTPLAAQAGNVTPTVDLRLLPVSRSVLNLPLAAHSEPQGLFTNSSDATRPRRRRTTRRDVSLDETAETPRPRVVHDDDAGTSGERDPSDREAGSAGRGDLSVDDAAPALQRMHGGAYDRQLLLTLLGRRHQSRRRQAPGRAVDLQRRDDRDRIGAGQLTGSPDRRLGERYAARGDDDGDRRRGLRIPASSAGEASRPSDVRGSSAEQRRFARRLAGRDRVTAWRTIRRPPWRRRHCRQRVTVGPPPGTPPGPRACGPAMPATVQSGT